MDETGKRGRRRGAHDLKPNQLLETYADWDAEEARYLRFERPITRFFKHVPIAFASGQRCLRDYNFPWPLVPHHDADNNLLLVYLIQNHPPYPLLYASAAVYAEMGYAQDALVGRSALETIRRGVIDAEPGMVRLSLAFIHGEVADNRTSVPRTYLSDVDGGRRPYRSEIWYSPLVETCYVQAVALPAVASSLAA